MESSGNKYAVKGGELELKADKKLNAGFFKSMFSSKSDRVEEACELYQQAAVQFKLGKQWQDSARVFLKAAKQMESIKEFSEAIDFKQEAANMLSKIDMTQAIKIYNEVSDGYCNMNRISAAARIKKKVAEMYETDYAYELAANFYQDCYDLYEMEGQSQHQAAKILLKVADLRTRDGTGDFVKAIKIYEKVADKYLMNKMTAGSSTALFFKAGVLYLANDDEIGCKKALENYEDKSPQWTTSRQSKLLNQLCEAIDKQDLKQYEQACTEYNQIITMNKWEIKLLSEVKKRVGKAEFDQNNADDPFDGTGGQEDEEEEEDPF